MSNGSQRFIIYQTLQKHLLSVLQSTPQDHVEAQAYLNGLSDEAFKGLAVHILLRVDTVFNPTSITYAMFEVLMDKPDKTYLEKITHPVYSIDDAFALMTVLAGIALTQFVNQRSDMPNHLSLWEKQAAKVRGIRNHRWWVYLSEMSRLTVDARSIGELN
jgi:hypothetical protein